MDRYIKMVSDLRDILLEKDKLKEPITINCNLDVLVIFLHSIRFEENSIVSVKVEQKDSKRNAIIQFKDNQIRAFEIKDEQLISHDGNICIFQQECSDKIKYLLNEYRYDYFKRCIKELESVNKDYAETLRIINIYDKTDK